MAFYLIFDIDDNIIQVYNHKNIKLFSQDFVNILLKYGQYISQSKKHYLVFKMIILDSKNYLSFVTLLNPYLIIGIGKIKLSKLSCLI